MASFSAGGVPHREAASAGVMEVLAPVPITVKPISQTRCRTVDNSEQKRNSKNGGIITVPRRRASLDAAVDKSQ